MRQGNCRWGIRRLIGILLAALLVVGGIAIRVWWKGGKPRRDSLRTVASLQMALASADQEATLETVVLPPALQGRTGAERGEFIRKALQDELTPDGISLLKQQASFGPLLELFPAEADLWAGQAGVNARDCVAFRLDQGGLRSELVLVKQGDVYRIVRCNNAKRMAAASASPVP